MNPLPHAGETGVDSSDAAGRLLHPLDLVIAAHSVVMLLAWGRLLPSWPWAGGFVLLHTGILALVWHARTLKDTPRRERLALLLSLVLLPVAWHELAIRYDVLRPAAHDALIAALDARLTGAAWHLTLAAAWPSPVVKQLLLTAYAMYFPLLVAPALLAWHRHGPRAARNAFAPVLATFLSCYALYVPITVLGPSNTGVTHPPRAEAIGAALIAVKHAFDSLGTAFPSSHTAASVATALAFLPLVRGPWRVVAVLQSVLVGIACVYTGNHYAIDVVAGAGMALLAGFVLLPLARRGVARLVATPPSA